MNIPNKFIAGTKAKANEVNENFEACKIAIDQVQVNCEHLDNLKENRSNKGVANGYAPLDENGQIDSSFMTSKADKDEVDGAWIPNYYPVFALGSLTQGSHNLDLSDYLPNDDYCYEISVQLESFSSVNQADQTFLYSDFYTGLNIGTTGFPIVLGCPKNTTNIDACGILIIPSNRILKVYHSITANAGISIYAYRRLGQKG